MDKWREGGREVVMVGGREGGRESWTEGGREGTEPGTDGRRGITRAGGTDGWTNREG